MLEKRFYGERVRRYTDKMARVLYDAYLKIDADRRDRGQPHPAPEEVDIISWPQTWPDARCGFDEVLRDVYEIDIRIEEIEGNRIGVYFA